MIQPLRDNVLIKPIPVEEKTKSGIILADYGRQSRLVRNMYPFKGEVVALGTSGEFPFAVGDIVYYERFGATSVIADETEFLIVPVSDVLCVSNANS